MWYSLLFLMPFDGNTSNMGPISDRTEPQYQIPWLSEGAVDLEEEEEGQTISREETIGKLPRARIFSVAHLNLMDASELNVT